MLVMGLWQFMKVKNRASRLGPGGLYSGRGGALGGGFGPSFGGGLSGAGMGAARRRGGAQTALRLHTRLLCCRCSVSGQRREPEYPAGLGLAWTMATTMTVKRMRVIHLQAALVGVEEAGSQGR